MNQSSYRAWQFMPLVDDVEPFAGLRLGPTGRVAMVDSEAAIRQSLMLLLSTVPGERVMRPEYGCNLQSLVFSANDDTAAGLAMHYVRRAVERWEPRIEILRLDAGPTEAFDGDDASVPGAMGILEIVLEYRVRTTGRIGRFIYQQESAGG